MDADEQRRMAGQSDEAARVRQESARAALDETLPADRAEWEAADLGDGRGDAEGAGERSS